MSDVIWEDIETPEVAEQMPKSVWEDVDDKPGQIQVPDMLKGTEYESEAKNIEDVLFSQGDEGFETAVDLDKGKIFLALQTYKGVNPETAAKAQKIANEFGIDTARYYADPKVWDEYKDAFDVYNSLFELKEDGTFRYPRVANWLNNPQNLAMAKDDLEPLRKIEGLLEAYKGSFLSRRWRDIKEGTKDVLRNSLDTLRFMFEDNAELTGRAGLESFNTEPAAEYNKQNLENIMKLRNAELLKPVHIPRSNGIEGFIADFTQMVPQLTGTIGTSFVGGPATGGAFMFGQIFGGTYGELRDKGVNPDRASTAAFANAAVQSALEVYGLDKLMKLFKSTGAVEIGKNFVSTLMAESGTEFLQAFPEDAARIWGEAEQLGQTPEEQLNIFWERLPETAKQGIYEGLVVAPVAFIGASGALVHDYAKVRRHEKDAEVFDQYVEVTSQSKLAQRAPEAFEEVSNAIFGEDKKIYIPLEPLKTYFQNDQKSLDFYIKRLGIEDQIEEAEITGKELEISMPKWSLAFKDVPEISKTLRKDIRFELDGMSENEKAQLSDKLRADLQDMQKEYQELIAQNRLPEPMRQIRETMMLPKDQGGFGMRAEDADANVQLFMAGAKTLSQQSGETIDQWFARVNPVLTVGGEGVQSDFNQYAGIKAQGADLTAYKDGIPDTNIKVYFQSERAKKAWQTPRDEYIKSPAEFESAFDIKQKKVKYKSVLGIIKKRGGIKPTKDFNTKYAKENGLLSILNKSGRSIDEWLRMLRDEGLDFKSADDLWNFLNSGKDKSVRTGWDVDITLEIENEYIERNKQYLKEAIEDGFTEEEIIAGFTPENARELIDRVTGELEKEVARDFTEDQRTQHKEYLDSLIDEIITRKLKEEKERCINEFRSRKHKDAVEQRLKENKKVPSEVLQDYPDLVAKYGIDLKQNDYIEEIEDNTFVTNIDIIRGGVQFADGMTLIKLFQSANYSTFLHESAHIFIEEMRKLVESGKADEQFQKDYQTFLDFAGVSDNVLDVKGAEKIARAFEAYLREGKAPSLNLTSAFRKFKQWLMNIYRSIRNLDVELNDDVRQVFDRLLASEREIKEAQGYYQAKKDISELLPDITPAQKEKLKKKKEDAEASTLEKQVQRTLKAYLDAIGGKVALQDYATREINAKPVYKALRDAEQNGGLNPWDIINNFGNKALKNIKAKFPEAIKEKGKYSVAELALKYEFESPDVFVQELRKAEAKQDAITNRTNELLKEREAQIRKQLEADETIAGEEALHNDAVLTLLIAEAEILSKKIEQAERRRMAHIEEKVYRDVAQDMLSQKSIARATRYDMYAKSEQRYAKESQNALQKGDFIAAHEAKKKQILNHVLVQEAIKIRDMKNDFARRYLPGKIKSALKNVENDFANVVLDLIQTYNLSENENVKPLGTLKLIADLDEVLASQVPSWIMNKQKPEGFKRWQDLTVKQVQELDETLKSIIHYGRGELKSIQDAQYKTVADIVEASIVSASVLKDKKVYNEFSKRGKWLNGWDKIASRVNMVQFIFERLDGYSVTKNKEFGPLRKLFNRGVQAEAEYNALKKEVFDASAPHIDVLYKAKQRLETAFGDKAFDIEGLTINEAMRKIGREQWTVERMIVFVLNLGNLGNKSALMNAYGYNDAQIDIMIRQFTADELNAIQGVWDATNLLFDRLDQTHYRVYNRHINKVQPQELIAETADGQTVTLQGGYYPLVFDHALNDTAAKFQEEDLMKNRATAVFRSTKPEDGMVFSRTPGHSLPPNLSLSPWFEHISDTARYISHAEYMRDLNRVTINKDWRNMVRDKEGREAYNQIRDYVKWLARPERRMPDMMGGLEKQRKLATMAILGLNIGSGIKQRLGLLNTMYEVGFKYVVDAYKQMDLKSSVLGSSNGETWQKIIAMSPYLKIREKNMDREVTDTVRRINPMIKKFNIMGKEFTWKDVQGFMFVWLEMNDRATIGVTWLAAYNKFTAEKTELDQEQRHKEAITYADTIVQNTQPSSLPTDLNSMQRSEGWMRLFTSFMSSSFILGNRYVSINKAYWKDGAISTKDYARHVCYELIAPSWGSIVITSLLMSGGFPTWWEWLYSPIDNFISFIPFLRDVSGYFKYRKPVGQSPAFEGFNRGLKAGNSFVKMLEGDKEFIDVLWDVARAAELQTGVPALRFTKDVYNIYLSVTGQQEK